MKNGFFPMVASELFSNPPCFRAATKDIGVLEFERTEARFEFARSADSRRDCGNRPRCGQIDSASMVPAATVVRRRPWSRFINFSPQSQRSDQSHLCSFPLVGIGETNT
jgi:hypothetical protein